MIRAEASTPSMTEQSSSLHGGALAVGAVAGAAVMAVVAGSFLFLLLLALGAAAGAVAAGVVAMARDRLQGATSASGERPIPKPLPNTGPAAQRAEAAGPSPEPARRA